MNQKNEKEQIDELSLARYEREVLRQTDLLEVTVPLGRFTPRQQRS